MDGRREVPAPGEAVPLPATGKRQGLDLTDDGRAFSEAHNDNAYDRFSSCRKWIITVILSFFAFNSNLSLQIVSPAIPEVAAALHTTGNVINFSNAMYSLFMGVSALFWAPMSDVYGKKWIGIISAVLFFGFSVATALSPNLATFFTFRILSAIMGTASHVIAPACISDIFDPATRGTALGWFVGGTLMAPSFGPFIGGFIAAYGGWRAAIWFQAALVGLSCASMVCFLPETGQSRPARRMENMKPAAQAQAVIQGPMRTLALFCRPKIILLGMATSSLMWNMQSLLTPVRYVINPRFDLTSPAQSGFFYLAPGVGYMIGSLAGGQFADWTARRWEVKRGVRVPEDRLRSSFVAMGIFIPGSIIIYGWAIDQEIGGIPLPVICMLVQGAAQMVCLPCLNAYCIEVLEGQGTGVMSGNLFIRHILAAVGTAICLPGINSIGIGWISTISGLFVALSCAGMYWVVWSSVAIIPKH